MEKIFTEKIGKNPKVYIDNIVTKIEKKLKNHVTYLQEIFDRDRKFNVCLNLEKCTFMVDRGKFLCFILFD